jgi:hypothetical protein
MEKVWEEKKLQEVMWELHERIGKRLSQDYKKKASEEMEGGRMVENQQL